MVEADLHKGVAGMGGILLKKYDDERIELTQNGNNTLSLTVVGPRSRLLRR